MKGKTIRGTHTHTILVKLEVGMCQSYNNERLGILFYHFDICYVSLYLESDTIERQKSN